MEPLNTTLVMEAIATAATHIKTELPMLLLYAHIILAALFPIYTGAHASLSRPASAAKAKKEQAEEEDEDEDTQIMEGLTASDAIVFPVTAGIVLATLYWLIKKYGADMINLIMAWYFAAAGIFSTAKLCSDGAELCINMLFPAYYSDGGIVYEVKTDERQSTSQYATRTTALPGFLGRLSLPQAINSSFWRFKQSLKQRYVLDAYVSGLLDIKSKFAILDVIGLLCGFAAVAYNNFVDKPWWLTNVQGFAVSYFALQLISPTSFVVGSLVLSGLFFYDIWAVFFTPLMVTVATNLDQPIKLLFPRPEGDKAYSMLGLGDIVLPGLIIALALRFDLFMYYQRQQKSTEDEKTAVKAEYTPAKGHWATRVWTASTPRRALPVVLQNASFPKPYFTVTLVGYVAGMTATLVFMTIFKHAQPALLYLVPAVLSSLWGTAAVRGELQVLWSYSEELNGEALQGEKENAEVVKQTEVQTSWWAMLLNWVGLGAQRTTPVVNERLKEEQAKQQKRDDERVDTIVHLSIVVHKRQPSAAKHVLKIE